MLLIWDLRDSTKERERERARESDGEHRTDRFHVGFHLQYFERGGFGFPFCSCLLDEIFIYFVYLFVSTVFREPTTTDIQPGAPKRELHGEFARGAGFLGGGHVGVSFFGSTPFVGWFAGEPKGKPSFCGAFNLNKDEPPISFFQGTSLR